MSNRRCLFSLLFHLIFVFYFFPSSFVFGKTPQSKSLFQKKSLEITILNGRWDNYKLFLSTKSSTTEKTKNSSSWSSTIKGGVRIWFLTGDTSTVYNSPTRSNSHQHTTQTIQIPGNLFLISYIKTRGSLETKRSTMPKSGHSVLWDRKFYLDLSRYKIDDYITFQLHAYFQNKHFPIGTKTYSIVSLFNKPGPKSISWKVGSLEIFIRVLSSDKAKILASLNKIKYRKLHHQFLRMHKKSKKLKKRDNSVKKSKIHTSQNHSVKLAPSSVKSIFGKWRALDENTGNTSYIFKIFKSKTGLIAKFVEVFDKSTNKVKYKLCTKCPGKLKNRNIIGLPFIFANKHPVFDHYSGSLILTKTGKIIKCKLWLNSNKSVLTLQGFVWPFSKKVKYYRVLD